MLGILDTQFVVKRVAQLARWARDRGGKGPAPRRGRGPRSRTTAPRARQAAGPALNLRNPVYAHGARAAQARPAAPGAGLPGLRRVRRRRVHRPALRRRTPGDRDAGGAESASGRPGLPGPGPRGRPRRRGPRMVTELAVEPIMRRTVDENYAGEQLVTGPPPRRRPPRPRDPGHPRRLGSRRRPGAAGRRAERTVGPPAVRPGAAGAGRSARRPVRRCVTQAAAVTDRTQKVTARPSWRRCVVLHTGCGA